MWNYRVVDIAADDELPIYEIREVYYNKKGEPFGHSEATVVGESTSEMREVIETMELAFKKPILMASVDFENDHDD